MFISCILSLNNVFILANSADPDKMLHDVAFHLDLHCLPKYLSMKRVNTKLIQDKKT